MNVYIADMRKVLPLLFIVLFCSLIAKANHPLIENKGQWPKHVHGMFDFPSGHLFLEGSSLTYDFWDYSEVSAAHANHKPLTKTPQVYGHSMKVEFLNANSDLDALFESEMPGYCNYFLGNDPSKWAAHAKRYRGAWFQELYDGIDMHFYTNDFTLKYDFIIAPEANPDLIQIEYNGADQLYLENGRLVAELSVNQLIEQAPIAFQIIGNEKVYVKCEFNLQGKVLSFRFPDGYQTSYPLTIDPELIFSTYSGSFSDNFGYTAAFDDEGYLYSGSSSFGAGYPISVGAYQEEWGGGDGQGNLNGTDIAISKYDVSGTFLVYSTFIGGQNDELPHSLITNENGELVVFGTSSSLNYPTTIDAISEDFQGGPNLAPEGVGVQYVNGCDIVVSKLSASGDVLIGSTFIGGTGNDGVNNSGNLKFNYADEFRGEVEIDSQGNILIASCTNSNDFPTVNQIQNASLNLDGVVFKMNSDLTNLIWSTYYGGNSDDACYSLAISSQDEVIVCGGSLSQGLEGTDGGWQTANNDETVDGFIVKLNEAGNTILAGTYLGSSSYDQAYFVELDNEENIHIYGQTMATGNTFIINALYGDPSSGMLVTKFNPELTELIWSTVFGTGSGKPNLSPTAFLVDVCGKIYLSGWGGSTNTNSNPDTDNVFGMETTDDAYQDTTNGSDFYLLVMESDASDLVYASFFGGNQSNEHVDGGTSRFNRKGQIYQSVCAGCGGNDDFPIFPANAVSPINNSNNCNNGVFKFDFQLPISVADFFVPTIGCVNEDIPFTNTSAGFESVSWDFGDDTGSSQNNPVHTYTDAGTYEITLVVSNPATCNMTDTLKKSIEIRFPMGSEADEAALCSGETIEIGVQNLNPDYIYSWSPSTYLSNVNQGQTECIPDSDIEYTLLIDTGVCIDTLYQSVSVEDLNITPDDDLLLCNEEELVIGVTSNLPNTAFTWSSNLEFNDQLNDNSNDPDIAVLADIPITYYVQGVSEYCTEIDSVQINFVNEQTEIGGDFTACSGDTIQLSVLNPSPLLSYSWEPEILIVAGQNTPYISAVVDENQAFTVFADDGNGCTSEDDVFVQVSTLNPNSIQAIASPANISTGESSTLSVVPDGFNYLWSPSNSLNSPDQSSTLASPEETTTYIVEVSDGECINAAAVTIRVFDFECGTPNIFVPNAFSPNGDAENDVLFVRGNNVTEMLFQVFNRWGEKVFESTRLQDGWDGIYNDKNVDPAVFVYHLTIKCGDGQEYFEKGNISLLE